MMLTCDGNYYVRDEVLDLIGMFMTKHPEAELHVLYGCFVVFLDEIRVEIWLDGWRMIESDQVTLYSYDSGEWTKTVMAIGS